MSDPLIEIEILGGFCPVQAEGRIDGQPFYFRARHSHWSIEIGGGFVLGGEGWRHEEEFEGAGWMLVGEARDFIAKAAKLWAARDE